MKAKDLTNQRFGRLIAIQDVGTTANGKSKVRLWSCKCDCGATTTVRSRGLLSGQTRSCGCLRSEVCRNKVLLPPGESGFNALLKHYKCSAKSKGLDFELTKEEFRKITSDVCFYCGKVPQQTSKILKGLTAYIYNGIDRYDNSIGYVLLNCVPCCSTCNYMKSNMHGDDFIKLIHLIYDNTRSANV